MSREAEERSGASPVDSTICYALFSLSEARGRKRALTDVPMPSIVANAK